MEKQKNIPQCRFPEFEGEWSSIKLGEYINITSGNSPSLYKLSGEGNYPFLKVEELNNSDKYQINSRFYTDDSKNLVEKNSIIFPKRGAAILVNKIRINAVPVQMDSNLMAIKPISANLNHEFLYYVINKERLYKIADTSTIPQINNKHIEPYKLYIPKRAEQHKIASFFTAIDQKISQLKRKKTLLEQYKKGVMQKIFSQEIRFKSDNGQEFPKWDKKKLGELAIKVTDKNKENQVTSVLTNSAVNGVVLQRDFFEKDIANQDNLINYYIVNVDDFVYNPRISSFAPVGPIKRNRICQGVMSPLYSVFKFHTGILAFYEYYFSTTKWHRYMEGIANYGARSDRMNITTNEFYEMPLPFPSIEEQTKIAYFLSTIDDKINHTQTQIEKAEVWKKGLMQQMFV